MKLEMERRRFSRVDSLIPCVYCPTRIPRQAVAINISAGGAALVAPFPVPRTQTVGIWFPASPGMSMLEAPAEVIHLSMRPNGTWLIGVAWADWAEWVPATLAPWLAPYLRLSS
jgi:hypothetical protein